jgi:putative nucleotidyltransferase with HDIG domain
METSSDIYLHCDSPPHQPAVDRLNELLKNKSAIPAFSQVAVKLCALAQDEDASMEDFASVVSLDSGLTARYLYMASSIGFAGRSIENINQALMIIGVKEIRRIAFTVAMIGAFSGFSAKIDWKKFWFHNVLVARLTEEISRLYRDLSGMEYLAGLLHDIGKVIVEHYFPKEFEQIMVGAVERQCSHAQMEMDILGVDHTQIGAAMCQRMQIHPHILRAVRFHHDPASVAHTSDKNGDGGFLAICICAADQVANNLGKLRREMAQPIPLLEYAPALSQLQQTKKGRPPELDIQKEIKKTEGDLAAML